MSDTSDSSSSSPREPVQRLITGLVHECIADLVRQDLRPEREAVAISAEGYLVIVSVAWKPAPEQLDLSPCERDILALLAGREGRITGEQIHLELERHGLFHGESTVKRALARLSRHDVRLLGSSRKAPKGYWLLPEQRDPVQSSDVV